MKISNKSEIFDNDLKTICPKKTDRNDQETSIEDSECDSAGIIVIVIFISIIKDNIKVNIFNPYNINNMSL